MIVFSSVAILAFALVLARVSGLLVIAPVFGARQIPLQSKVGLAVVITLVLTPLQISRITTLPAGVVAYGVLVGRELLVGLAIGFAVSLIYTGVQMGSHLLGVQIGFGLGGVLNPESGADGGVIDGFYAVLATVIFLAANGHHAVLLALARTYEVAPIGELAAPVVDPARVMALVQSVFMVALRIVLPTLGALLLADVGLGLIGRTAPQMQVMVVGAPVKIAVALLVLAASTPSTALIMDSVFRGAGRSVTALFGSPS